MTVIMQAISSTDGHTYQWRADDWDAGAGFTGPGSPLHLCKIAGISTAEASASLPAGMTPNFQFDRYVYSPTHNPAAIQAALNSLVSGGTIFIPAGTWTLTVPLYAYGRRSNITIIGAGMGRTIIDFTNCSKTANKNAMGLTGAISIGPDSFGAPAYGGGATPTSISGITVQDLTLRSTATTSSGPSDFALSAVLFYNCNESRCIRVEVDGAGTISHVNDSTITSTDFEAYGGRCINSTRYDLYSNSFNPVTDRIDGYHIHDWTFDTIWDAVLVTGRNLKVVYCTFRRVKERGVLMGENNGHVAPSIIGSECSYNKFFELGYGNAHDSGLDCNGIICENPGDIVYDDGRNASPMRCIGNEFHDTIADANAECFRVLGSAEIRGTQFGSRKGAAGGFGVAITWRGASSSVMRTLRLSDNTLESPQTGLGFVHGILLDKQDNFTLALDGGNTFDTGSGSALELSGTGSGTPIVSCNGDKFKGQVQFTPSGRILNADGSLDGEKLHGASNASIVTTYAANVMQLVETTPLSGNLNVRGRNHIAIADLSPAIITGLTGGIDGQRVTLVFSNGNTTINNRRHLVLTSSFTSAADASISLELRGGYWVETSRAAPYGVLAAAADFLSLTPALWFDSYSGIELGSNGTDLVHWFDRVGNLIAQSALGTPQFISSDADFDEAPAAVFNGSDSMYVASGSAFATSNTMIVVCKPTASQTGNRIVAGVSNGSSAQYIWSGMAGGNWGTQMPIAEVAGLSPLNVGSVECLTLKVTAPNNITLRRNGTENTVVTGTAFPGADFIRIGGYPGQNSIAHVCCVALFPYVFNGTTDDATAAKALSRLYHATF